MYAEMVVMKFGGTSLGTAARFRRAARRVAAECAQRKVIVVVSAPGRTTDRILQLIGRSVPASPWSPCRETERALTTGEDLSAAVLAAVLSRMGLKSRSLNGREAGLVVDDASGRVIPDAVRPVIGRLLAQDVVPVVSGFQGTNGHGDVVTLGRGGSDLTAIVLADAFGTECHLITDVDGVYDRDPRQSQAARFFPGLTHDELCRLCRDAPAGASVVQAEAAEWARARRVPLRVFHYAAAVPPRGFTRINAEIVAGGVAC